MQTIHPLLVHFPVAMLSLYGVLEIISLFPVIKRFDLRLTKLVLVIVGTVGGMLASVTGEAIEHSFQGLRNLVEMHSTFASMTNILGVIISIMLIIHMILPLLIVRLTQNNTVVRVLAQIDTVTSSRVVIIILAIAVVISITITGALGAVIVHGPDVDPVVKFIYQALVQ